MIKLKNVEAVAFTTPAIQTLFNDNKRTFPMVDAFLISDAIEVIRKRLTTYFEEQKKIIESNKGKIAHDGNVTYPSFDDQMKAATAINELNEIELEYNIDKITPSPDWPRITLSEAFILKPILNQNGGKK